MRTIGFTEEDIERHMAAADSVRVKEELKRTTEEAVRRGERSFTIFLTILIV